MARKKGKPRKCSMYSDLHTDVAELLAEDNITFKFDPNDTEEGVIRTKDTNIMGRFICHNSTCKSNGWSSKMIAITIRAYSGHRYNARIYHQHCKVCNSISRPRLDKSYAERVAYRLKKWEGVIQEEPKYSVKSKGPHDTDLCEGCQAGHCTYR